MQIPVYHKPAYRYHDHAPVNMNAAHGRRQAFCCAGQSQGHWAAKGHMSLASSYLGACGGQLERRAKGTGVAAVPTHLLVSPMMQPNSWCALKPGVPVRKPLYKIIYHFNTCKFLFTMSNSILLTTAGSVLYTSGF